MKDITSYQKPFNQQDLIYLSRAKKCQLVNKTMKSSNWKNYLLKLLPTLEKHFYFQFLKTSKLILLEKAFLILLGYTLKSSVDHPQIMHQLAVKHPTKSFAILIDSFTPDQEAVIWRKKGYLVKIKGIDPLSEFNAIAYQIRVLDGNKLITRQEADQQNCIQKKNISVEVLHLRKKNISSEAVALRNLIEDIDGNIQIKSFNPIDHQFFWDIISDKVFSKPTGDYPNSYITIRKSLSLLGESPFSLEDLVQLNELKSIYAEKKITNPNILKMMNHNQESVSWIDVIYWLLDYGRKNQLLYENHRVLQLDQYLQKYLGQLKKYPSHGWNLDSLPQILNQLYPIQ